METIFITVHDLSLDARIRYCSDSIEYILGYLPHEVKGKSCWEFFHPDEIPFAKSIHGRGIELDKAAVLNYCRIKHRDGYWVGCECVFTVVYDVLVASTSIYRCGPKARRRAIDGAGVRRVFSSSPRDPRYHMLAFLSNKFYQEPSPHAREPRAALFLNRFTRTSTIMFATNGVSQILGIQADKLIGKSFYFCIAENCLTDAIKCLESAKANDSIAYLRFWYRDPLTPDSQFHTSSITDTDDSDEEEDGGVSIRSGRRSSVEMTDAPVFQTANSSAANVHVNGALKSLPNYVTQPVRKPDLIAPVTTCPSQMNGSESRTASDSTHNTRDSSGNSTDLDGNAADAIFDPPTLRTSSSSETPQDEDPGIEIEAVVSCTSDGLVVVLRRARALVPYILRDSADTAYYANGLFASPWAADPVIPKGMNRATVTPAIAFPATQVPAEPGFMSVIRDVAAFAWSLTGINGSLAQYGRGNPSGEALPPGGLPVWDPNSNADPENRHNGFLGSVHRPFDGMSEPVRLKQDKDEESGTSSEDEVLWKRAPSMPTWRKPKRRGHHDAFGGDGVDATDGQNANGGRKKISKLFD